MKNDLSVQKPNFIMIQNTEKSNDKSDIKSIKKEEEYLKKIKDLEKEIKIYKSKEETKSQRLNSLIRPSLFKKLKKYSKKNKQSVNETVNLALEKYLENEE